MPDLIELLEEHASDSSAPFARYLETGDVGGATQRWTYAELQGRARAIATELLARGVEREPVLLAYEPGLEVFAAFLGVVSAGAIAVPLVPPSVRRPERSAGRLSAIAADCSARFVLTSTALVACGEALRAHGSALSSLTWIATDALERSQGDAWSRPDGVGSGLSHLQYTSGSTGKPKGVRVTHSNVLHNTGLIATRFGEPRPAVTWLPHYHDMGLVGMFLTELRLRQELTVLAPNAFLQRPARWLEVISKDRIGNSAAPNFAYALCAERVDPAAIEGLDLSCWKTALCGAEPVQSETLRRFCERFGPYGFSPEALRPAYGLAEATLLVTCAPQRAAPRELKIGGRQRVSSGPVAPGLELLIVNPETREPLPEGDEGEVWVRGESVADGYWGQPELSAEFFSATTATGEGPFLRTGDLGVVDAGELYVTGRLKDLLIVNGRNVYPQDLELCVESSHDGVRLGGVAAFGVEGPEGAEAVVVAAEVDRRDPDELRQIQRAALRALAQRHHVAATLFLCRRASLPKTSSGKIRRSAARDAFLAGELSIVLEPQAPGAGDSGGAAGRPTWPFASRVSEVETQAGRALSASASARSDAGGDLPKGDDDVPKSDDAPDAPASDGDALEAPESDEPGEPECGDDASQGDDAAQSGAAPALAERLRTRAEISAWLRTWIAGATGYAVDDVDVDMPLVGYGLDSGQAVELASELSDRTGHEVDPALTFDYPTVREIAGALAGAHGEDSEDGEEGDPTSAAETESADETESASLAGDAGPERVDALAAPNALATPAEPSPSAVTSASTESSSASSPESTPTADALSKPRPESEAEETAGVSAGDPPDDERVDQAGEPGPASVADADLQGASGEASPPSGLSRRSELEEPPNAVTPSEHDFPAAAADAPAPPESNTPDTETSTHATELPPISVGTLLLLDAAFVVALTLCVGPALLSTAGLGSLLLRVLPPATVLVLSPAWAGLTFLLVLALCVGLLRTVVPQPGPGIYDLKGPQATAWGVNFVLQRVASLPLWRPAFYAVASLRWLILHALGAKIAFRVRTAMDAEVLDAYLIEIEPDTMLAGGTSVSAHLTAGGKLHLARVHIERGVELWAGASVAMGVHVGAQSRIGAHTRVLPHAKIGAGCRVGSFCRVGEGCQIGEGAVIGDEVNLGRGVVVEAGARVANGERVPPGTRVRA